MSLKAPQLALLSNGDLITVLMPGTAILRRAVFVCYVEPDRDLCRVELVTTRAQRTLPTLSIIAVHEGG